MIKKLLGEDFYEDIFETFKDVSLYYVIMKMILNIRDRHNILTWVVVIYIMKKFINYIFKNCTWNDLMKFIITFLVSMGIIGGTIGWLYNVDTYNILGTLKYVAALYIVSYLYHYHKKNKYKKYLKRN